ncbi:MAG TPA: hypothetical protein VFQ53_32730 [Kofleriaceae bacterium]|nr:hypothetical protein [Kofleriaceae bacterium]
MAFHDLECTFVGRGGSLVDLGRLDVVIRISAAGVAAPSFGERTRAELLERLPEDGAWSHAERTPALEEIEELVACLRDVQFPGIPPELDGHVDTSDVWEAISLDVRLDGARAHMRLGMQASGFDGPDAERWLEVFRAMFRIVGYAGYFWAR